MHSKSMTIGFPIRFVLLSFERLGFNLKSIRSTRHHWQVYNNAFKEVVQNSVARSIRVFPPLHPSPAPQQWAHLFTLLPFLPLVDLIAVRNNMPAHTHTIMVSSNSYSLDVAIGMLFSKAVIESCHASIRMYAYAEIA